MAAGGSPAGLPRQRVVGPMWGPNETDVDGRVGFQHARLLRVRPTLLIATGLLLAISVVVAVAGSTDTAIGIVAILVAPPLLIVAVLQVIVMLTRPNDEPGRPNSR